MSTPSNKRDISERIVLGLDPSLNNTGWCVLRCVNFEEFYLIDIGNIKNSTSATINDKIAKIVHEIDVVCANNEIESAGIEETFLNTNASSSLKLGIVRGVCMSVLCQHNIPFAEYHNRQIKKIISGNGSATKEEIGFFVNLMVKNSKSYISQVDQSDALSIAIGHYFMTSSKY